MKNNQQLPADNKSLVEKPKEVKPPKSGTKIRTITAACIISVTLPLALLGDWFFFGLICIILVGGILEAIRCAQIKYTIFLYIVTILIGILLLGSPLFTTLIKEGFPSRVFSHFLNINLSPIVIFVTIVLLFFTVVVDKNFTIRDACFVLTMILMISFGLQCALFIRYYPVHLFFLDGSHDSLPYFNIHENLYSSFLLLFVVLSAVLSDTGGYFFGMLFGHYKMNERISPKKTWEGFIGGIATSFFICSLIGLLVPTISNGEISLLDGVLDLEHWYNILILSAFLPTISVLGDFVFSSIKRFYGIKDFSNIFPGHGGILDRIDSLLFAFMAASTYIHTWLIFVS